MTQVSGFRGQRVGLAVKFLHQKIQPPPGLFAGREHTPALGEVRVKPVELLGHVGAIGEQDNLLLHPRRIELLLHFLQPRFQPLAVKLRHLGQYRAHTGDDFFHRREARQQQFLQPRALARTGVDKLVERACKQRQRLAPQALDVYRGALHYPRPAQHIYGAQRRQRRAGFALRAGREFLQAAHLSGVERRVGRRGAREPQAGVHLAALEARLHEFAYARFERA